LNPYANRWKCGRQADAVEAGVRRAGIDYRLRGSSGRGHAITLARAAAQRGGLPRGAGGGDGTPDGNGNGRVQGQAPGAGLAGPVGTVPLGTCNDLATMLGIPEGIDASIALMKSGITRTIDVGSANGYFFVNNAAVGLETEVALENDRMTRLRGVFRYLVAAVVTIMKRPRWQTELAWDDGQYKGSLTLVSVGNSKRTGGVFYMTPNAIPDDGKLDFIYAPALTRMQMFRLLPQTLKGTHIAQPVIHEHRTTRLKISTAPATAIQTDGEISAAEANEIDFTVIPRALRIFAPQA
ncbi:MAG TPA: diacylglycerol kinase family protein, partial [Anaerolineales bacterium]|nr:diacylglycerol kinase family protein [Anaerolineales bacterium]